MAMAKPDTVVLFALALLPFGALAQAQDTVWIPNDFTVGTMNNVIPGDNLSNGNPVNPTTRRGPCPVCGSGLRDGRTD